MSVRAKVPSDDPAILDLARSLRRWFIDEGIREMTRDLPVHQGFVATAGNEIVGFVTWNEVASGIANLSWIGVQESRQHKGIGTALIDALGRDLRVRGYRTLEVSTVADSVVYEPYAQTLRFYRSRGFTDYRVDSQFFGEGNARYDRLLLRKSLR